MREIIIAGAGYAGLRAALDLGAAQRKGQLGEARLTVVDRNDYHQVVTWLHDVAAASVEAEAARIPLSRLLGDGTLNVMQGDVRGLAPKEQRILLMDGTLLSYDRVVVALGSETLWPPVPGLRDQALPLRWWNEAFALREAIMTSFADAAATQDAAERRRLMTIVVVGGGYTGCQLAGELSHWLPALADQFGLSIFDITLRQIEAQPRLVPNWQPQLSSQAERTLRQKGVQLLLDSPLAEVGPTHFRIGERPPMPYGVMAWTGGVQAPALLAESGFRTGAQGRVVVDDYLRAEGFPTAYVAGDCALWMDGEKPLPATASHALRQGEYVARSLQREFHGEPLGRYEPTKLGLVMSLGGNDAVGTALGVPLYGPTAGLLKEGIESWYLSTIGVK